VTGRRRFRAWPPNCGEWFEQDKTADAIALGQKAKALLEDETLGKAFAEIEKRFVDRWKTTTDTAERDRCWMAVNLTTQVKNMLAVYVSNGKLSQQDLDAILAKAA
jgi:hypothetical protein